MDKSAFGIQPDNSGDAFLKQSHREEIDPEEIDPEAILSADVIDNVRTDEPKKSGLKWQLEQLMKNGFGTGNRGDGDGGGGGAAGAPPQEEYTWEKSHNNDGPDFP